MARPEIFTPDSPSVSVETTSTADDGTWLTSGKVTFELAGGEKLEFRFKQARNEREAVEQALSELEWFLKRFERAAARQRERMA